MPKLKVLSGKNVVKIFGLFGFEVISQKGSHMKLHRRLDGLDQTLTVPNHTELAKGTLKEILNHATKYISEEKLRSYFYTK
jgi:predicted RNA binding protein YcfA (HicA-like mRNA interferase family)